MSDKHRNIFGKDGIAMKSHADFTGVMPYSNGFFGIYQPLLNWKARIFGNRFDSSRSARIGAPVEQAQTAEAVSQRAPLNGPTAAGSAIDGDCQALANSEPEFVAGSNGAQPRLDPSIDCGIARLLQRDIGNNPPRDWSRLITPELMTKRLEQLETIVARANELPKFPDIAEYVQKFAQAIGSSDQSLVIQSLLNKEARVSSFLLFVSRHKPTQLNELFFTEPQVD